MYMMRLSFLLFLSNSALPLSVYGSLQYLWQEGRREEALKVLAEAKKKRRYQVRYKPYLNRSDGRWGGRGGDRGDTRGEGTDVV
jgi:hypothetical protein